MLWDWAQGARRVFMSIWCVSVSSILLFTFQVLTVPHRFSDTTINTTSCTLPWRCVLITIYRLPTICRVFIPNYTFFILCSFDDGRPQHTFFKDSRMAPAIQIHLRAFLLLWRWHAPFIVHKLLHTIPYPNHRFVRWEEMEEIIPSETRIGVVPYHTDFRRDHASFSLIIVISEVLSLLHLCSCSVTCSSKSSIRIEFEFEFEFWVTRWRDSVCAS